MKIYAYIGNPIIQNQEDYSHLAKQVQADYPHVDEIHIMPDKLVIINLGRRSFKYPDKPTIDWLIGRVKYVYENNI